MNGNGGEKKTAYRVCSGHGGIARKSLQSFLVKAFESGRGGEAEAEVRGRGRKEGEKYTSNHHRPKGAPPVGGIEKKKKFHPPNKPTQQVGGKRGKR